MRFSGATGYTGPDVGRFGARKPDSFNGVEGRAREDIEKELEGGGVGELDDELFDFLSAAPKLSSALKSLLYLSPEPN